MKKTTVVKSTPSKTYLMWCVASATVFGYDHTSLGLILWASCAAPTLVAGGVGFNFHRCRALTGSNEYKCTPAWHSASFRGYRHQKEACALKSYRNPHKQKKVCLGRSHGDYYPCGAPNAPIEVGTPSGWRQTLLSKR